MKESVFFSLFAVTYFFIFVEYLYSRYKKDGVYSSSGTLGNLLRGVFLQFFSYYIVGFYIFLLALSSDSFYAKILSFRNTEFSIINFIYGLLIVDFCWYLFHKTNHTIPFLRRLHKTHHGDDKLNLSTALRVSWIEQLYILIFFLPALLILDIKSMYWAFFSLNFYQFFVHSQYIKIPNKLSFILITQDLHKVHHSQDRESQNSNFGGIFSFWDRMFGSFKNPSDEEGEFKIGLKDYHQNNFIKMETDHLFLKNVKNH